MGLGQWEAGSLHLKDPCPLVILSSSLLQLNETPNLRLDGNGTGVSPLQGTKIVIQNLQTSVTQVNKEIIVSLITSSSFIGRHP